MNIFKKRLKQVGKDIMFWVVTFIIVGLIMWGVLLIPTGVTNVIGIVFFGLIFIGLLAGLGYNIWKFINWLFVEPFKKK